jgi:acetylornithine aminotransferase
MIGVEMDNAAEFRKHLIQDKHVFTGFSGPNTIRLLPPLNITIKEAKEFIGLLSSTQKN